MSGIPAEGVKAFLSVHWARTGRRCSECQETILPGGKYYGMQIQPNPGRDSLHALRYYLCEECSPVEPGARMPFPWEGRSLGKNWRTEYDVPRIPLRHALLAAPVGRMVHIAEMRSLVRVQAQARILCGAPPQLEIKSNYSITPGQPEAEAQWLASLAISPRSLAEAPPGVHLLHEAPFSGTLCGRCRSAYEELTESWNLL